MIRIAFVHNNFPAGGAERVTIDIASYLKGFDDYEVFVYAHRIRTDAGKHNITLRQIPSQAIQSRRSKAIEKFVIADKIDILVQVGKSLHDIEGIKERTGVKVVLACHGEVFWQRHAIMNRRRNKKLLWKLFYRKRYQDGSLAMKMAQERSLHDYMTCDAYTVLCEGYRQQFEKAFDIKSSGSKIWAIENCERPVERINYDKKKTALFCGRLENWSKRIDSLLRIWQKVQYRLPDWTLKIVGGGKDEAMLREYAASLGLERVEFAGMQSDPSGFYDEASLVLMTSQTEGWGLVLTEAMARGCICMAFDCSEGVRSIFGEGALKGLCIEGRNEESYATKLLETASMTEEKIFQTRRMCVENVSRFAPEIIMSKWKKLFDTLIENDKN